MPILKKNIIFEPPRIFENENFDVRAPALAKILELDF